MKTRLIASIVLLITSALCAQSEVIPLKKKSSDGTLLDGFNTGAKTIKISATGTLEWVNGATLTGASYFRTAAGLAIGTNVQAYDADLTTIGALANAAGVMTNNGSGVFSYTATSTGGNGTDDSGKIAKFNTLGQIAGGFVGSFEAGPSYDFVAMDEGLFIGSETNSGRFGIPTSGGTGLVWTLPGVTGILVSTGDTGSVTNTMLAGSIALTKLLQSSATSGQVIAWNGTAWAPATISSGLTIGSTAISGGTSGRLLMSGSTVGELTLGSNVATWLITPTEANLKAATSGLEWLDTRGVITVGSAVSAPARQFTGAWYAAGTGTTTLPHILIEPTGTTASTTWDTAGTGLGINGSTGTLFDVKTNGVGAGDYTPNTNFKITADGYVWFGTYKMLGTNYGGCNAYGNLYYTSGAGINFQNGSSLAFNNDSYLYAAPFGGSSITGVLHLNGYNSTEELRISANGTANAGSYLGLKFDGTNGVISSTGIVKITAPIGLPTGTNARAGNATLVAGTVTVSNATVTTSTLVILTRKTAGGTIGGLTYTLSSGSSFTINSDSATDTSTVSYLLIENP